MNIDKHRHRYYEDTLDKFVDKFVSGDDENAAVPIEPDDNPRASATDDNSRPVNHIRYYRRNIVSYFFVRREGYDAVRKGNSKRMARIHKDFLLYFKVDRSFNACAIEVMVINVPQNEVLFSEQEAHHLVPDSQLETAGKMLRLT